ncbi:MAG TPA: biotin/lipoyl-containing protein [Polyangiales bacterium]|nr:biotin/lipoyl-containing protein [Polyangiales bacterium]
MAKHRFVIDGAAFEVEVHARGRDHADVSVNGRRYRVQTGQESAQAAPGRAVAVPKAAGGRVASGPGEVRAPMAGKVLAISAHAGSTVARGEPLLVLDAMKMENTLGSPLDGVVEEISVKPGDTVLQGALLVSLRA